MLLYEINPGNYEFVCSIIVLWFHDFVQDFSIPEAAYWILANQKNGLEIVFLSVYDMIILKKILYLPLPMDIY